MNEKWRADSKAIENLRQKSGKDYRVAYSRSGRRARLFLHDEANIYGKRASPDLTLREFVDFVNNLAVMSSTASES